MSTEDEPIPGDTEHAHLGLLGYDDAIERTLTPLWQIGRAHV